MCSGTSYGSEPDRWRRCPEHIHQDALEPGSDCGILLQGPEGSVSTEEGLLHQILRPIPDEPSGQRVQRRKLRDHHSLELLLRSVSDVHLAHVHGPATRPFHLKDDCRTELIASVQTGNEASEVDVF